MNRDMIMLSWRDAFVMQCNLFTTVAATGGHNEEGDGYFSLYFRD